ncbi:NDP-hexose 2,3-dehydratase family protein [Micromonosporaceae bacterium B7E4]
MFRDLTEFHAWFDERHRANAYRVVPTALDDLQGWLVEPETGNIRHRSGRFFRVEGLRVHTDNRSVNSWEQPIIVQPEVGILGILTKDFGGVPHCLMQAKMEPGNINLLQLSPTLQATRSNYTRVHDGASVPYLDYFLSPDRDRVVFDALQSEQGSWFLCKRNRNMIVRAEGDVPVREDYCWLSLRQLGELLREDNVINMDTRTVLSGMSSLAGPGGGVGGRRHRPADDRGPDVGAMHTTEQILSWFTETKTRHRLERELIPLAQVRQWVREPYRIAHEQNRHFSVIGVDVQATNREVAQWSQPMVAPRGRGLVAFVGREINHGFHVLVHARTEAGSFDVVEIAPTVQCIPDSYRDVPDAVRPTYLDYVLNARPEQHLLDVVLSEEGGRFYHAENRYLVVNSGDDLPVEAPEGFLWMTLAQLANLVPYSNYLNVSTRSLLSCLHSEWWSESLTGPTLVRA